jgi:hypothetical protein
VVEPADVPALLAAGREALRTGQFVQAQNAFRSLTQLAPQQALHWFGLAMAEFKADAPLAALTAIDAAIAREPGNLRSHLFRADLLHSLDRGREAAASYQTVVRLAQTADAPLGADLRADVARAEAVADHYRGQFETFLRQSLHAQMDGRHGKRFAEALDILVGRKPIYTQQPKYFYFPGLADRAFFEREEFDWIPGLEAQTGAIRAELEAVMVQGANFSPYLEQKDMIAGASSPLVNNLDWSAYFFWKNGEAFPSHQNACPNTIRSMADIPLVQVSNRSPSVLFSQLRPKAVIPPHNGLVNTRLICHLPLIVPPGCRFRVGNDERNWKEGQIWVFDDSIEHEAVNTSDQTRVILLFEVWRPDLSLEERSLVTTLFATIDRFGGPEQEWGI